MRCRPTVAAATLAACLLAGWAHAAATPPLRLEPCRLRGVEHPLLCGVLQRPLDPADAGSARFDLHVAVVPALARNKLPDPVFFLAGGPGQSAIELAGAASRLLARLGNRRDLVLVDQRGTGRSAPLACDDDDARQRLQQQVDPQVQTQSLARCRAALQKLPHGDLRRYTTVLAMQDLDAVRQALGAERINLVGGSYGTRAGLEYLRQFPAQVRRAVLDGVAPPDMVLPLSMGQDARSALDGLLQACQDDATCRQRHPRLAAQWAALLQSLPRDVTLRHALSGADETVRLTADQLVALVRGPLYAPSLASALPAAIERAASGNWVPLAGLAQSMAGSRTLRLYLGMHFSVLCTEDAPRMGATAGADTWAQMGERYRATCADWPRGEVPADFYRVGPTPAPVLLMSGGRDPVTPPRHAERVAQALGPKARHVVVPQAGHGVMAIGCLRDVIWRFVDAADDAAALAVDTGCAAKVPRPPWFEPLTGAAP